MNSHDKNKILDEILKGRSHDLGGLPDIVDRKFWWSDFFEDSMKAILDWFGSLLPSQINSSSDWVASLTKSILAICGAFLIIGIVYILYQAYLIFADRKASVKKDPIPQVKSSSVESTLEQIETLLEQGRYREAVRLRWKILLRNLKLGVSLTPVEVADQRPSRMLGGGSSMSIRGVKVVNLYQIMFGPSQLSKEEVQACFASFQSIEENLYGGES